jgi:N-glycosylase/DNA lyase
MAGVRVLNQDKWETLLCYLASSNNNIPRIHKLMEDLRKTFGERLLSVPRPDGENWEWYAYPTLEELSKVLNLDEDGKEKQLRGIGFGYRDKFYAETCKILMAKESPLGGDLRPTKECLREMRAKRKKGGKGKKKSKKKKVRLGRLETYPANI